MGQRARGGTNVHDLDKVRQQVENLLPAVVPQCVGPPEPVLVVLGNVGVEEGRNAHHVRLGPKHAEVCDVGVSGLGPGVVGRTPGIPRDCAPSVGRVRPEGWQEGGYSQAPSILPRCCWMPCGPSEDQSGTRCKPPVWLRTEAHESANDGPSNVETNGLLSTLYWALEPLYWLIHCTILSMSHGPQHACRQADQRLGLWRGLVTGDWGLMGIGDGGPGTGDWGLDDGRRNRTISNETKTLNPAASAAWYASASCWSPYGSLGPALRAKPSMPALFAWAMSSSHWAKVWPEVSPSYACG